MTKVLFYNCVSCQLDCILEYSVQAFGPHFRTDIDLLEGVQRRANKLISSIRDETYEDKLSYLKLATLETRRYRGDLIECFDNLDIVCLLIWIGQNTSGHSLKYGET